jgi:hypothetical protein
MEEGLRIGFGSHWFNVATQCVEGHILTLPIMTSLPDRGSARIYSQTDNRVR